MNINNPTTFGTPSLTLSTSNSSGTGGALRADDTILVFDTTLPAATGTPATGSASTVGRRDHVHAGTQLAAPALTLGTANSAGAASTSLATNSTLLVFDTTLPAAVGTAATGSASTAGRRDHVHGPLPVQVNVQIETRSAAAASGDVSYTGAGFRPTGIMVFSMNTEDDNSVMIGAIDDNVDEASIKLFGIGGTQTAGTETTVVCQFYQVGGDNNQQATAKTLDADGCTLTWTKSASGRAGSFMLVYLG